MVCLQNKANTYESYHGNGMDYSLRIEHAVFTAKYSVPSPASDAGFFL